MLLELLPEILPEFLLEILLDVLPEILPEFLPEILLEFREEILTEILREFFPEILMEILWINEIIRAVNPVLVICFSGSAPRSPPGPLEVTTCCGEIHGDLQTTAGRQ